MFHGFSGLSSLMLIHTPCHAGGGGGVQGLVVSRSSGRMSGPLVSL